MRSVRPAIAAHPQSFGRRQPRPTWIPSISLSEDAKLFLTTFAAGFLFVSLLIA
jgi:hypothetical protein